MSTRVIPARMAVAALLLAAGVALSAADRPEPPRVVEEIVAKVNGDIVTRGQLTQAIAGKEKEMRAQGLNGAQFTETLEKVKSGELAAQIDELLLVQKGKELDIKVDDELNKEMADIQENSKITDPDKFHDYVRENAGMSYEDFRLLKKNGILTQRVIREEVWRNILIPEADLRKYYDAHKSEFVRKESVALREIMVSTGDGKPATVAAAQKKAQALLDRARAGTDKFGDLARQNSDAPSAADDGVLDVFEKGKLNKAIEDVVFKHEKGYITDLIRVSAGFEILKIEEHIPEGQATFDDVKPQLNDILIRPMADGRLRAYLTDLRTRAFLQIKPGYTDVAAAPNKDTTWKDPAKLVPETTTKAAVANQRHFKKLFGVIPYKMTGVKDTAPATPTAPTTPNSPVTTPDGQPVR